jgi:hypothetical protein
MSGSFKTDNLICSFQTLMTFNRPETIVIIRLVKYTSLLRVDDLADSYEND